ncbi:MAG: DUF3368 domain-containing protein [Anaerolineae bacterium]|jgi:predicted nucleic acid-binding protein|nr:DUF3368 domain-containing protein [Anaerolineae bacterium]
MKAVINATPLIAFAMLERLDLLRQMFDAILVPPAVYREVTPAGATRPGASLIARATWLQIITPQAQPTLEPLLLGLDAGETEVLLLAHEIAPDWVLIDERQGRRVARAMGLPLKGTLGLLLTAVLAGFLSKEDALADLERLTASGIRISQRWQDWLKKELETIEHPPL